MLPRRLFASLAFVVLCSASATSAAWPWRPGNRSASSSSSSRASSAASRPDRARTPRFGAPRASSTAARSAAATRSQRANRDYLRRTAGPRARGQFQSHMGHLARSVGGAEFRDMAGALGNLSQGEYNAMLAVPRRFDSGPLAHTDEQIQARIIENHLATQVGLNASKVVNLAARNGGDLGRAQRFASAVVEAARRDPTPGRLQAAESFARQVDHVVDARRAARR